jgi:hypothetical protein
VVEAVFDTCLNSALCFEKVTDSKLQGIEKQQKVAV